MPYELFLALRYLRSRRRRPLARVTAVLALVGVACGVGSLIVAIALANGFRDEMRDKILRGTAHITIMRADGQPIADYNQIIASARKVGGVIGASPTTYDGAVVTGPNGSTYAVLRGVDPGSASARAELQKTLTSGSARSLFDPAVDEHNQPQLPNVVIGAELAKQTGLSVDDIAEIIPASASVARRAPIRRNVHIAGIFRSGLFEYDSTWIYLAFDRAAIFVGSERAASVISVEVLNVDEVGSIAATLRHTLGDKFAIVDWKQANVRLFAALELERRAGMVVIALIILIAALNITTTLVLVVVERRSDIAILRTMGAKATSILNMFLIQGAFIGITGAILGVALGWLACLAGNRFKLVRLPADVYSIGNVPFNSRMSDMLIAVTIAVVLTLLATIYPAFAAARMRPVETLRDRN
jgi:lipoprotein-releasing system permease protein